jgi:hypothetical protein
MLKSEVNPTILAVQSTLVTAADYFAISFLFNEDHVPKLLCYCPDAHEVFRCAMPAVK